jgi:hypothetical protein
VAPQRWGVPTTYDGIHFRSRLEARWAHLFTRLKWQWEYEPFDLGGYIPDFAILGRRPMLIEVKPALSYSECHEVLEGLAPKLGGVKYDVMVVGSSPTLPGAITVSDAAPVGAMHEGEGGWIQAGHAAPADLVAEWGLCRQCRSVMVHHDIGFWTSRPCGHVNKANGGSDLDLIIAQVWKEAVNATRWEAS